MAYPTFQAVSPTVSSVFVSSGAALTVTWPTHLAGDLGFLIVESDVAISLSTASGFVATYFAQSATGTVLSVYHARATSSAMASPIVAATSDHIAAGMVTFRNCEAPVATMSAGTVKSTASTSVSFPSFTTTVAETLIVGFASTSADGATTAWASATTNATLASITEHIDARTSTGNGGGIFCFSGQKATAGAIGTTTSTVVSATNGLQITALQYRAPGYKISYNSGTGTIPAIGNTLTWDVSLDYQGTGTITQIINNTTAAVGILVVVPTDPVFWDPPYAINTTISTPSGWFATISSITLVGSALISATTAADAASSGSVSVTARVTPQVTPNRYNRIRHLIGR